MTPMPPYRRTQTLRQMSVAMVAFVLLALVLESGGLYDWAQRLELGPERTVALPAATALHRALAPLGLERQRHRILVGLAELGWSDDPQLLAEAHPVPQSADEVITIPTSPAIPLAGTVTSSTPALNQPVVPLPLAVSLAAVPVLTELPKPADAAPAQHIEVALTGDSMMAVGLSAAVQRDGPRYKNLSFLNLFKSGTGLARPEVFNWQLEYPAMLKDEHPDFVIVAIGANDAQGFQIGRTIYPFGTQEWEQLYAARVDAFIRMLTAHGATVIWVGLPPMKDPSFAARIDLVNRIQYSVVSAVPHAIWLSSAGLIGDDKGAFRDFGQVHGKPERLRAADGIHMSDDGAQLITGKLVPWLAAQPGKEQPKEAPKEKSPTPANAGAGDTELKPKP
jgi:uncharacterized protein